MNDALGVGLAANQLGTLNRVLVYRVATAAPVAALINPGIDVEDLTELFLAQPEQLHQLRRALSLRASERNAAHGSTPSSPYVRLRASVNASAENRCS
jgi:hypothetical protein